jgi:hypothetical protein
VTITLVKPDLLHLFPVGPDGDLTMDMRALCGVRPDPNPCDGDAAGRCPACDAMLDLRMDAIEAAYRMTDGAFRDSKIDLAMTSGLAFHDLCEALTREIGWDPRVEVYGE